MDCVVLGTGGMMPMPMRLTTSVLLRKEGRMLLFDAGEGIQLALKKGGLGICNLDVVTISHLHADHVLGLPGIIMFKAQCDNTDPLTIIGPPGIERFIRHTIEDLRYHVNFNLNFIEWTEQSDDIAYRWNDCTISWTPLRHSTFCLSYTVRENQRPGRFNLEKALALDIPKGPLYGQLQSGRTIELDNGNIISPADVLGPSRAGRSVAFATDTSPCKGLKKACSNVDLAFVEGMFMNKHEAEAMQKKHMTAAQAAIAAQKAGAKKLVLLHISPRYTYADEDILEHEAKEYFDDVTVGKALKTYDLPLND